MRALQEEKVIAGSIKRTFCILRDKLPFQCCFVINLEYAYLSLPGQTFAAGILPIFLQIYIHTVCVQCLPTFAWVTCTELSLDRPIWASNVAPRPLRGVWVSAVIVISNTYRRNDKNSSPLLLMPHGNIGLSVCLSLCLPCCVG